jgi:uncharacterized protein YjgD (DUF1641 family)|tara:strand:+ start:235 stop:990 length:756 start_codon:yes stop_codon:yes gene_type:complete
MIFIKFLSVKCLYTFFHARREKMNDSESLQLLRSIDERLSRLEKQVNKSQSIEEVALRPEVSILADIIDENFSPSSREGRENLAKVEVLKDLLQELSDEESLQSIKTLTKKLKNLTPYIEQIDELENVVSIMTDSLDEIMSHAIAHGLNIEELGENLKKMSGHLIEIIESGALTQLLESGVLDPKSIEIVGALGNSLAISKNHTKSVGIFGVLSSVYNKDVQRSLGFALNLATHFGRKLNQKNVKEIKHGK